MAIMRRLLIAFLVAGALLGSSSSAQATTSIRFEANFDDLSLTGKVAQFGAVSYTLVFGGCTDPFPPALVTVTFSDGSTLTWCQVGNNRVDVQGGLIEPFTGPFTVIGGTGVFAGATGSGVQVGIWVHDRKTGELRVTRRHYSAVITVP